MSWNISKTYRPSIGTIFRSFEPSALDAKCFTTSSLGMPRRRPHMCASGPATVTTARVYRYSKSNPKMFQPVTMSGSSSLRYRPRRSSISRSVSNDSHSGPFVFLTQKHFRSKYPSRPNSFVVTATWKHVSFSLNAFGNAPDSEYDSISRLAILKGAMSSRSTGFRVRQSDTHRSMSHDESWPGLAFSGTWTHPVDLISDRCMKRRTGSRFFSYTLSPRGRHSFMSASVRNPSFRNVYSSWFRNPQRSLRRMTAEL